jgi:GNAT superfamily N-acetyltransferase
MTIQRNLETICVPLMDGIEMRSISREEFQPLFDRYRPLVFANKPSVNTRLIYSDAEKASSEELNSLMGSPVSLNLGVFHGDTFIGWHCGDQRSREEFYMQNTGIFPEYQGRGIYTAMLKHIPEALAKIGFQVISSKHNATNNRVIIPKLKAGFIISGLEISDRFGTLVRLEYFTNPKRRALMDFRSGQANPSADLRALMGL